MRLVFQWTFSFHSMTVKETADVSQCWVPSTSDGYGADSVALHTGFLSLSLFPASWDLG